LAVGAAVPALLGLLPPGGPRRSIGPYAGRV